MSRLALAALLALTAPALADTAADKAKAAAHYKQGKAFEGAKQYDQAIAEYKAAHAIDKQPAHLYNIGRAYQLKGDLQLAIETYQAYLVADPSSARGKEVRESVVALTKQLAEEQAKRDEEAKKKLAEERRAKAAAHVSQAEAYAKAGAWVSAGDEHRAAMEADGDPAHLLAAAEAYGKAPDLAKQRDAYAAYLERVPGDTSAPIRTKLAEVTSALEKTELTKRQGTASPITTGELVVPAVRKPARGQTPGKLGFGAEVRTAIHQTADFVNNAGLQAKNKSGIHLTVGGFGDLWLSPGRRLQAGLRAVFVKNGYGAADCGDPACPKDIEIGMVGPAVALEQSLSRRDSFNVHVQIGASVGFGLSKTLLTFDDMEEPLPGFTNPQLGVDLGLGIRNGRLSIALGAQLYVTGVSSELDIGNSRSFGLSVGWSSRR